MSKETKNSVTRTYHRFGTKLHNEGDNSEASIFTPLTRRSNRLSITRSRVPNGPTNVIDLTIVESQKNQVDERMSKTNEVRISKSKRAKVEKQTTNENGNGKNNAAPVGDFVSTEKRFVKVKSKIGSVSKSNQVEMVRKETDVEGNSRRQVKKLNERCSRVDKRRRIRARAPPNSLYNILSSINNAQKQSLVEIGFESYRNFNISEIPSSIAMYVVDNFDHKSCSINIKGKTVSITRETVHEYLGVPMGRKRVEALKKTKMSNPVTLEWRSQFPRGLKRIYPKVVADKMVDLKEGGRLFKLNFLVLFFTSIAEVTKCGAVNQKFLPCLENIDKVKDLDWCGYVLECLKKTKASWKGDSHYNGPLVFLVLLFANTVKAQNIQTEEFVPVINLWTTSNLIEVEEDELEESINENLIEIDDVRQADDDDLMQDDDDDDDDFELTLKQIKERKLKLEMNKRSKNEKMKRRSKKRKKCINTHEIDGIRLDIEGTSEVGFHRGNNNEGGKTYIDGSNTYSTQNITGALSKPNIETGVEGLYATIEGGFVSYKAKTKKEFKDVVELNLEILSDIIGETMNVVDDALTTFPDDGEFKHFKTLLRKKYNNELVSSNDNDYQEREKESGKDQIYEQTVPNDIHVSQLYKSPTVMRNLEDSERRLVEKNARVYETVQKFEEKKRRLNFDEPSFDLGVSQFIKDMVDVGEKVQKDVGEKVEKVVQVREKCDAREGGNEIEENAIDKLEKKGVVNTNILTINISREEEVKKKRILKPSSIMVSPYVSRVVDFDGIMSLAEKNIANCIFAARLP